MHEGAQLPNIAGPVTIMGSLNPELLSQKRQVLKLHSELEQKMPEQRDDVFATFAQRFQV
jgi:hypothetical protein